MHNKEQTFKFKYEGDGAYLSKNGIRYTLKQERVGYSVQQEGDTEWFLLAAFECTNFGFKKETESN